MKSISLSLGGLSSKNQVGLYVDAETIAVAHSQPAGSAMHVSGFAELRVSTALDGGADAKQKTVDNIKTALTSAGVRSKGILVSIPGEGSMTRHFELPVLPKKEERNAVRFEAQKYVPFDMKDLYYDYETYLDVERKRNRVVFFACKKQWVDTLSALLTLAGMKIAHVELVSHSIARTFLRHAAKNAEEVSLIVISNDSKTAELVIQKSGSVLTTRHVPLARIDNGGAFDVPAFVSEVRISIDYFLENFKGMKIDRVFLATPFSGEAEPLCEAMRQGLAMPVEAGELFVPPTQTVSSTGAVAAYGLTLSALEKRGAKRIGLKPTEATLLAPTITWEEEKKQLQDLAVKELIVLLVLTGALYFFINGVVSAKNRKLMNAVNSYEKSKTASMSDTFVDLQNKQMAIGQKSTFFGTLTDKRTYLTLKMNELAKHIPSNILLKEFDYRDALNSNGASDVTLYLKGYVLSADTGSELSVVNRFVQALLENKVFMLGIEDVRIASTKKVTYDTRNVMQFTIACAAKGK